MVKMRAHTPNAFEYIARVWVKSGDYWEVYWDITERIAKDFAANDIEIPYNIVDVKLPNKEISYDNK